MVKLTEKIKTWIYQNKWEFIILVLILLVGAVMRLYKINQYLTFLGDEGRDVIIVRKIITQLHPALIGPGTSIGNMYLGPLYYYMMVLPLLLANFSPVGPAVMVALLGVLTIFFVWFIGREWFGKVGAVTSSLFYAIAPTVIIYSRSSWNPDIMPFFALLTVYAIWQVWKYHIWKWLIVLGVAYACVLQSHYLGLLLIPIIGIYGLLTLKSIWKDSSVKRAFIKKGLIAGGLFLFLMSPLVFFDARHGWINFQAMKTFFSVREKTVSINPGTALPNVWPIIKGSTERLLAGRNVVGGLIYTLVLLGGSVGLLITKRKKLTPEFSRGLTLLLVWLGFSALGLGLYKQQIYDHYYGFFFPVPFLIVGGVVAGIDKFSAGYLKYIVIAVVTGPLLVLNIMQNPLKDAPNRQLQRTREIAGLILAKANGQRMNIATISERNNRDVYQYFLQIWGAKVVDTDPMATKITVTDQLFVVCEKPKNTCNPVNDPSAWIANFGWSKIVDSWDIAGVTVFKLGHAK